MIKKLIPFFPKQWILFVLITVICSGIIALFEVVSISLLPFFFGETGSLLNFYLKECNCHSYEVYSKHDNNGIFGYFREKFI